MIDLLCNKIKEYIDLTESDIQIIKSLFKKEEYKANSVVLSEGLICNKLWFIAKGLVRFACNVDGDERNFIFKEEGSFISEIEGFIKQSASTKSIITIEDCVLYSIRKSDLEKFYNTVQNGERFGRLLVEEIFLAATKHIVSVYTQNAETRYYNLIKNNNDFIQRIPQYHIASFLGIKPQSLCRIKKRIRI